MTDLVKRLRQGGWYKGRWDKEAADRIEELEKLETICLSINNSRGDSAGVTYGLEKIGEYFNPPSS